MIDERLRKDDVYKGESIRRMREAEGKQLKVGQRIPNLAESWRWEYESYRPGKNCATIERPMEWRKSASYDALRRKGASMNVVMLI
jgi:hypothetical protein